MPVIKEKRKKTSTQSRRDGQREKDLIHAKGKTYRSAKSRKLKKKKKSATILQSKRNKGGGPPIYQHKKGQPSNFKAQSSTKGSDAPQSIRSETTQSPGRKKIATFIHRNRSPCAEISEERGDLSNGRVVEREKEMLLLKHELQRKKGVIKNWNRRCCLLKGRGRSCDHKTQKKKKKKKKKGKKRGGLVLSSIHQTRRLKA